MPMNTRFTRLYNNEEYVKENIRHSLSHHVIFKVLSDLAHSTAGHEHVCFA